MKDGNTKYILTIEFNPDTEEIEIVEETIIEPSPCPIIFKGNLEVLDYIDDEHISKITVYEIAES